MLSKAQHKFIETSFDALVQRTNSLAQDDFIRCAASKHDYNGQQNVRVEQRV